MVKSAETRRNLHTHTHTHTCNPLLSLKQIGTICFVFSLILISTKSYSDIAANNSNPSCDNSTLNTYTGPAALEAKWNANTIQLKWYKDDELLTVQTAANQCTYDGTMTLPSTRPTKTGYDFNGWKVKTGGSSSSGGLVCGLTNEIISAQPSHQWSKGGNENVTNVCLSDAGPVDCSSDATFGTMNFNTWKVQSSYGMYEGIASCNSTNIDENEYEAFFASLMDQMEAGTLTEEEAMGAYIEFLSSSVMTRSSNTFNSNSTGQYCWCKATGYTPNSGQQCVLNSQSWVFMSEMGSDFSCADLCARYCSSNFSNLSTALYSN